MSSSDRYRQNNVKLISTSSRKVRRYVPSLQRGSPELTSRRPCFPPSLAVLDGRPDEKREDSEHSSSAVDVKV